MKTYPLLQSQLGVLLQSMQHPDSTQYNLPNYTFMPLSMTRERVVSAVQKLVESFPELHTRFVVGEQGEVRQCCDMSMPIPVATRKCTEAELQTYINEGFVRPFDLFGSEPLFRAEVIETEKNICMLFDGHHSIVDGMSFVPIISKALARILEGGTIEVPSYGMYQAAEDEAEAFGTETYQRAKEYYAQKFAGLEMATLSHSPYGTMGAMGRKTTTVSRKVCDDWCREHGVQVNLLFQAAFSHVVSVLTRQQQVAYAAVNHGRIDKRLRNSVGMFVKTVPIMVNADPSQRVVDFIKCLRSELMSTIRYGIYPFTHFCSDLVMKPGIMFDFLAVDDMEEHMMLSESEIRAGQPVRKEIDSDISVDIYLKGDSYEIRVQSSLAMNDEATLQMVAEAVRVAVCNMVARPEATLGELDIVSDEECDALVQLGTGERHDFDHKDTLVSLFRRQAVATPDATAVVFGDRRMTYSELDSLTDRLACQLINKYNVQPEEAIGVMIDRSELMVVYPLAIMKVGGCYMPLDYTLPADRLQYMCEDADVKLIMSEEGRVSKAMPDYKGDVCTMDVVECTKDNDESSIINCPLELARFACKELSISPSQRFVILYTSGSTGRPKGVILEHHSIVNFCHWYNKEFRMAPDDRALAFSNFGFDAHMMDLYPALTAGASVYIISSEMRMDIASMNHYMEENAINIAFLTTQVGHLFVSSIENHSLRLLSVGGEKLMPVRKPPYEFYNCYGPTECTIYATWYKVYSDYDSSVIGQPLDNYQLYVVDPSMRLLPRGMAGELVICGEGVGRGYLHSSPEDANKFVMFNEQRAYRTGDLVRWADDDNLEFLGRIDSQVKLRGLRIEMDEIEACASRFKGISQAVAVVKTLSGSDVICLYYTTSEAETNIDSNELRRFMAQTLADYMVPAAYMQLDTLPLTLNGKVDRHLLPEPKLQQENLVAPMSELERQLFSIVAEQMGTDAISVTSDLVSLGLSSLDAMRLSLAIGQQTGLMVPMVELLQHPTIRHMAEVAHRPQAEADIDLADFHRELNSYPLTENQLGIYLDWEMNRNTTQYNVPVAICLGQQDATQLVEALQQVINAHSYIKTRLAQQEEGIVQLRRDDAPVKVTVTALDNEPDRNFIQQRVRPFNLFTDDLYRLEIYTYGGRTWLFKDFHHIVSDGLSDAIFFREVLTACQGTKPHAETVTSFDYALYEQQLSTTDRYAEARDYFDSLLAGTEVAIYPRSSNSTKHESQYLTAKINNSESIRKACHRMGITPNSYFLTVVTQVLHRLTRQQCLMLATVSNGRSLAQMQNMMGMFVKTLPVVSEIAAEGLTFATAAQTMHRQSIESMNRDFYPLTEMVERHDLRPEILYDFEGGIYDNVAAAFSPGTNIIVPPLDTQKMPIEVTVYPDREGDYTLLLSFDTALYSYASMQALANALTAYATHAAQEGVLLSDVELTTDEERIALVQLGKGEHLDIDPQMTFVKAFEQRAALCSNQLAVADATSCLTYGELSRRSDILAHRLIESGVKPGDFVAVMLDRTIDFPLAVIAIHKAGAAYVPIDLEYPANRKKYILDDCQAKVVIDSQFMSTFNFQLSTLNSPIDLSMSDGLAYMIYTSGSTDRPKGVMIGQSALWYFVNTAIHAIGLTSADRVGSHFSFSFDGHVEDLFPILTLGGSVHIMPSDIRLNLENIKQFLKDNNITYTGFTTHVAVMMLNTYGDALPIRTINSGGEKMPPAYSDRINIINSYGPTECTCVSSYYTLPRGKRVDNVPIGRPALNSYYFLTDPMGRLVPRGAVGELCFASQQVARGYWQQPELTAEKFTDCPFIHHPSSISPLKMYRTGDLCRWNTDGQMEYIGRTDSQVKLRGYRIELGEIENCASRFEGIGQVAAQITNGQYICLYYTADAAVDVNALKQHLANRLAAYMIPTAYMQLDAMPLNANGKIDRSRLPEPSTTAKLENVSPRTEKDVVLLVIAQHVLGRDDFGITDDLFDLGLTSITAIKVAAMADASGVLISVNNLMRFRTIQQVFDAETPVGYWFNNYSPEKPVLIVPHGAVPVISMTEKFREWQNHFSIYTFEPADEHASRLSPDFDYDKLIMAYADLLDRDIPADAHVFGFLGYSWGGELGYSLAAQWQQRHGGKPQVYICDTFVYEPDDPKMTEEQILQVLVQYLMSHAADFDMSGLQTPEDGENGAVFNMTQMKFGKDASFAGEVLKIVTKKFYYSELYRHIQPLPIYDGHVTFFVATHENPRMTENLSRWKKVAPTMEIIEINDNHFNFSLRNKNTYLVTERLLDDLRHELRNKKSEE